MKRKKLITVLTISIISLFTFAIVIYYGFYLNLSSGVTDASYTLELRDIPHYQLNEEVSLKNMDIIISEIKEIDNNIEWEVIIGSKKMNAKLFDDTHLIMVALDDTLITASGSYAKSNKLYFKNFAEGVNFNQICILENDTNKIVAVINLSE